MDFSFRVVFIVSSSSAPLGGQLLGDMFYVNVPEGYYNIVQKVKHTMGLVSKCCNELRRFYRHQGVTTFLVNAISP